MPSKRKDPTYIVDRTKFGIENIPMNRKARRIMGRLNRKHYTTYLSPQKKPWKDIPYWGDLK